MRESSTATNARQQAATKRTKPPQQPAAATAQHPADWLQLSFELNVMTWREKYKQSKQEKQAVKRVALSLLPYTLT